VQRVWLLRIFLIVVVLVLVIFGVSYAASLGSIQISRIDIEGNNVVSDERIRTIVYEKTEGGIVWIFPKTNIFLYPKELIRQSIFEAFPRIRSVTVDTDFFHRIVVIVQERQPYAQWCAASGEKEICHYLDETGYVFAESPSFSGGAFTRFYGVIKGDPLKKRYVSEKTFTALNTLVAGLRDLSWYPVRVVASSDKGFVLYSENMGKIFYSTMIPPEQVLSNFTSILQDTTLSISRTPRENIEYIDFRSGNKVFYRLTQEE